jgi:hypothetical protein
MHLVMHGPLLSGHQVQVISNVAELSHLLLHIMYGVVSSASGRCDQLSK